MKAVQVVFDEETLARLDDPLLDAAVARPAYTDRQPRLLFDEAAALSSQTVLRPYRAFKLGMARDDCNNRQLSLNILHWLSRAI